jgi:hypothetical protein
MNSRRFIRLVGLGEERRRDGDAKRFCAREIHHQLKFGRLLDGKIGRLGALEDLVDVARGSSDKIKPAGSIGH